MEDHEASKNHLYGMGSYISCSPEVPTINRNRKTISEGETITVVDMGKEETKHGTSIDNLQKTI